MRSTAGSAEGRKTPSSPRGNRRPHKYISEVLHGRQPNTKCIWYFLSGICKDSGTHPGNKPDWRPGNADTTPVGNASNDRWCMVRQNCFQSRWDSARLQSGVKSGVRCLIFPSSDVTGSAQCLGLAGIDSLRFGGVQKHEHSRRSHRILDVAKNLRRLSPRAVAVLCSSGI